MKKTLSQRVLVIAAVIGVLVPEAFAFSPTGGSPLDQFSIRFIRWQFSDFDTDRDGFVDQDTEGIDITIERGALGFTAREEEIVEEAFDVWANVESSFAAFQFGPPVFDSPTVLADIDGLNLVSIEFAGEPTALAAGMLGITVQQFSLEDTFITSQDGSVTIPVTGGRMIEADIIVSGAAHTSPGPGIPPAADLLGTMVTQIGYLLGLNIATVNNVELDPASGIPIESPVLGARDLEGRIRQVGVTPSMLPLVFFVDEGDGILIDGARDLALDDIAGVSFMYSRVSSGRYFSINQEVRNLARPGFATQPLLGALVTAWLDTDGNPATSRVPVVSTMTGMYEHGFDFFERGKFELRGLPIQIETPDGGQIIDATYTVTMEPIDGSSIVGLTPALLDSTHNTPGDTGWGLSGAAYDTTFFSETFNEDGMLFGRSNFEVGTPLMFDQALGAVVSADTGQTLSQILGRNTPMFGEADEVCPLNVIQNIAGVTVFPNMMRQFRDGVLLASPLGVAAVDVYYQTGPSVAQFLLTNSLALGAAKWMALAAEWSLTHLELTTLLLMLMMVVGLVRRRRHAMRLALIPMLILGLFWSVEQGEARLLYMTDEDLADAATAIVTGTVSSSQSRIRDTGLSIVTDTVVRVGSSLKGQINKQSDIVLTYPGGRVGGHRTYSSELARFEEGEEVVLYLQFVEGSGYLIVGGFQGKVTVNTKAGTGTKYLKRSTPLALAATENSSKSRSDLSEGEVAFDDYWAELRRVVREQAENR